MQSHSQLAIRPTSAITGPLIIVQMKNVYGPFKMCTYMHVHSTYEYTYVVMYVCIALVV